ncbi:MAG: hypothetical protein DYG89_01500 [Caldilinea sp. CFX5]|nr:hypothetical protein [Caldilinea sp. CFX5]
MKCPVCSTELRITDRQGVEIDYCPQCRGVWLDRGELDKIIERAAADYRSAPVAQPGRPAPYRERDDDDDYEDRYKDSHKDRYYGDKEKHKRKSFLGDLFDF